MFRHNVHTVFRSSAITVGTQQISDSSCLRAKEFCSENYRWCHWTSLSVVPSLDLESLSVNKQNENCCILSFGWLSCFWNCFETSAHKIQKPGNHPKERIIHSQRVESLKSRRKIITPSTGNSKWNNKWSIAVIGWHNTDNMVTAEVHRYGIYSSSILYIKLHGLL